MNKNKLIITITIAFVVIFVPITVWLLKKNTDNRSRASGETPTVTLTTTIANYPFGPPLPIDITINSGTLPITVVDIKFKYNPSSVQAVTFLSNKVLDTELTPTDISQDQQNKGEFHYHAVETIGKNISGTIKLGQLIVMGKIEGISKIEIVSAQIGTENTLISVAATPLTLNFSNATLADTEPAPIPTQTPTTPLPTVANTSGQAMLTARVMLPGIGSDEKRGENSKPKRTTRTAKIQIYSVQNSLVKEVETSLTYNPSESTYNGLASLGDIPSEQYTLKISFDNTLVTTLSSNVPLSKNNTFTTNPVELNPGDINGDGTLSITDYSLLQSC